MIHFKMITTQEEKLIVSVWRLMDYIEELYNYKCISKQVADDIYTQLYIAKDLIKRDFRTYIMRKNEELQGNKCWTK